jgi:hypothetical protein
VKSLLAFARSRKRQKTKLSTVRQFAPRLLGRRAMAARMAKGMDPLGDLPSGSDSDADSDDAAPVDAGEKTAPSKPTEAKIDYEALRKHGMKTAPTLEGIKGDGGGEGTWGWSRGSRDAGRDAMTGEELHEATNAGLERACARSIEAAEAKRNARAADREKREAEVAVRLGARAVAGMLMFATVAGILMALFLNTAGGAWDNAKKFVETGAHGGKNSEAHKAAVTGDTVGDPFKDTAGPSIHVLIKMLATITLVMAPVFLD